MTATTAKPQISIDFHADVYRPAAVKKAAYRLSDRLHMHIEPCGNDVLRVTMRLRAGGDIESLGGEFCNEVLDQELREAVAEETRPVRDLIMAQAFSAVSFVDPNGDVGCYLEDPKGIRGSEMKDRV